MLVAVAVVVQPEQVVVVIALVVLDVVQVALVEEAVASLLFLLLHRCA